MTTQITHFDKIADIYDETLPLHIVRHYLERRSDFLKRFAKKGPVLDVGAGTGRLGSMLTECGRIIAFDRSFEMLLHSPDTLNTINGDALMLPFRSDSFQLVYSVASLHHIPSRVQCASVIKEMWRVMKKNGCMVVWDHNPLNPYWPILMKKMPQDNEPTRLISLQEIIGVLCEIGAVNIKWFRTGWVPEFCPQFFLPVMRSLEWILERIPVVKNFAAHNVIICNKI